MKKIVFFLIALSLFIFLPLESAIHIGHISAIKRRVKELKNKIDTNQAVEITLDWTNETNYTADGLNPETGEKTTTFTYRVKYQNTKNYAPAAGYPRVHILKGGTAITGSPFAMTFVSGTNLSGAIYTYDRTLATAGTDYTYYFEARDTQNNTATGDPTTAKDAPDVTETLLAWTAETNYTADGLNPETGDITTTFTYRVEYSDAEGDAPASGYPKVHILKGGAEITGSPFAMTYVSGTNLAGAIYTYGKTLIAGTDYTYYFEAEDVNGVSATGDPTSAKDAPDVTETLLAWTAETNYTADGLNPETGDTTTTFTYRVEYSDAEGDAPASGYPKVHILKGGAEITGSPFAMTYVSGTNLAGAIYTYGTTLVNSGDDYTYYFEAEDVNGVSATGDPTSAKDAPDVTETLLNWTAETNYTADGLNPETGDTTTTFTYRVEYSDAEGDAPASGYPKVHILKGGAEITGSPFAMTYVSGTNLAGAIYTYGRTLVAGTDYTYYFEAEDVNGVSATGDPTTAKDAPDVTNPPSWHIETVDNSGIVGGYTSIALNSADNPQISYYDGSNTDVKHASWNGSAWVLDIANSSADPRYTSIAVDSNDNPQIGQSLTSLTQVKYLSWNGTSWDAQTIYSDDARFLSLTLDSSDNAHISYYENVLDDLVYLRYNGTSWVRTIVDSAGSVGQTSSIVLDSNEYPRISYYDVTNTALKYAKWNGTSWDIETVDNSAAVGLYTSIAIDSSDNIHISYYDASGDNLKYASWNGTSWDIEAVDSVGNVGTYTSIELDSNEYPHISYRDETNGNLKYASWNGTSWDIETVDNTGNVGAYSSLELDSNDYAYISYYDSTNTALKYARFGP